MTTTRQRPPARTALGAALLTAAAGCCLVALQPAAAGAAAVPVSQPLVTLMSTHVARTAPRDSAHRIQSVSARRPLTHVRTVLPVLDRTTTGGTLWLRVRLPGRPNSHDGWIPATHTAPATTSWHLSLKLSSRRVTAFHDGRALRHFSAVVGKASTPTPTGEFFVEEVVKISSSDPGGPFALATSALSTVFQEFEGGPGQIAIHGTHNLSGALGTAGSHGCIRLSPSAITWLARRINSGATLTITR